MSPAVAGARTAAAVGTLYAAVSAYWGLGGTALLDTVGGAFQREGRSGSLGLVVVVWLTVLVKLAVAGLGVAAVDRGRRLSFGRRRRVRLAAWAAAVILTVYGGVLSIVGWLVQLGVIAAARDANHRALRWHAFLWDPWFLIWGLLLVFALSRPPSRATSHRRPGMLFG